MARRRHTRYLPRKHKFYPLGAPGTGYTVVRKVAHNDADAKARNDKSMQRSLEKVKKILDIHKIADYSEEMTEEFRTQLNKLSANKKY